VCVCVCVCVCAVGKSADYLAYICEIGDAVDGWAKRFQSSLHMHACLVCNYTCNFYLFGWVQPKKKLRNN
jgi:hypothetical protein